MNNLAETAILFVLDPGLLRREVMTPTLECAFDWHNSAPMYDVAEA